MFANKKSVNLHKLQNIYIFPWQNHHLELRSLIRLSFNDRQKLVLLHNDFLNFQ